MARKPLIFLLLVIFPVFAVACSPTPATVATRSTTPPPITTTTATPSPTPPEASTPTATATPTSTKTPNLQFSFDKDRKVWFDYIQFLDTNSQVIQTIDFGLSDRKYLSEGWNNPEYWDQYWTYRVKSYICSCKNIASLSIPVPENARFLKIRAATTDKWGQLSRNLVVKEYKDLMADTVKMETSLNGRVVDNQVELHARMQIHYANLSPLSDSDGDGVKDGEDINPRVPTPHPVKSDINVALNYMVSWNQETKLRSEDLNIGTLVHPSIGYYHSDDPDIVDWHIKWAVEHGISTFVIGCFISPTGRQEQDFENGFLRAKFLPYIKYFVAYTDMGLLPGNQWGNSGEGLETLPTVAIEYLSRNHFDGPQYLKVGDRPVFEDICIMSDYYDKPGLEKYTKVMDNFRVAGKTYGYDIYLIGGIMDVWKGPNNELMAKQLDAISCYMISDAGTDGWKPNEKGGYSVTGPYSTMGSGYVQYCKYWLPLINKNNVRMVPPIASGMNNQLMYDMGIDNWLNNHTNPSPEEFKKFCIAMNDYIDPVLNMVIIYAWNEFHEGTALEPTEEWGFSYLDALREVYCTEPESGYPPNITPQGVK